MTLEFLQKLANAKQLTWSVSQRNLFQMDRTQWSVLLDDYPYLKSKKKVIIGTSYFYIVSDRALGKVSIRQACIAKHVSTWSDETKPVIRSTYFKN